MSEIRDCEPLSFDDLKRVAFHLYGLLDFDEASKVSLVRIPINDDADERVEVGGEEPDLQPAGWMPFVALALIVAAALVLSR